MAIPDYQTVMLPLLKLASDGEDHSMRDAVRLLADQFGLSEEERNELLPFKVSDSISEYNLSISS